MFSNQMYINIVAADHSMEKTTVCQESVKPILESAIRSNSDALLIIREDEIKCEWYSDEDEPIQLMSVTKSIVSLGIGSLLQQGYLDSLNHAIHHLYPEWNQGKKKEIILQHILNHTSGIQNVPNAGEEIYPSKDVVQLALASELSSNPGETFIYNNKAVNLLSGIFEKTAGIKMDQYLQKYLFEPLEISAFEWQKDPSGNPYAMAGLALKASDLLKIGKLILNDGIWGEQRLIAESYMTAFLNGNNEETAVNLWWKVPEYQTYTLTSSKLNELEQRGISEKIIWKLSHIKDQPIEGRDQLIQKLVSMFGAQLPSVREELMSDPENPLFEMKRGEIVALAAEGYLGQYMLVIPEKQVVAIRLVKWKTAYNPETDGMNDFIEVILSSL